MLGLRRLEHPYMSLFFGFYLLGVLVVTFDPLILLLGYGICDAVYDEQSCIGLTHFILGRLKTQDSSYGLYIDATLLGSFFFKGHMSLKSAC